MPRDDGLFGGDVHAGLARLRQKLLDLTNRNRLLNFTHSKRGNVRAIDELPDVLFDRLVEQGKTFSFIPVRRLNKRELEDYENDYRRDHSLGPDEEVPEPDVRRVASMYRLDTSFEMPIPSGDEEKHWDDKIQTLLYPEDLEASLGNLLRQANLGLQETGVNFLHLAIGFLEWDDPQQPGQKKFQAPLLLIPVRLNKGAVEAETGLRLFSIEYSGDDLRDNLSLRMRLHEMGLELPSLESADGSIKRPERLFKECEGLLRSKPSWRIRRYVTLSMFQFGKMVMFEDLDPERWGERIYNHALVKTFFEGSPRAPEDGASVYEDLDGADSWRAHPIIEDADSSQHSALVDAVNGKNLVIEGPPGTGKSQTITNLIAATLNAGKTVLFVSEKMAALDVVKRRLDEAGLGHFCLELHSHKTQKSILIDNIRERLDLHGSFSTPSQIDQAIGRFEATRDKIASYVALLNKNWGGLDHTVQEILNEAVRYRVCLGSSFNQLNELTFDNTETFSASQLDEFDDAVEAFANAWKKALRDTTASEHPFIGVICSGLDELDFDTFWARLNDLTESVKEVTEVVEQIPAIAVDERPTSIKDIDHLIETIDALPDIESIEIPSWFGALLDADNKALIESGCRDLEHWHSLTAELAGLLEPHTSGASDTVHALAEFAKVEAVEQFADRTARDLEATIEQFKERVDRIRKAEYGLRELEEALDAAFPKTMQSLFDAAKVIELASEAPTNHLHLRAPEICGSAIDVALSKCEERCTEIRGIEDDLRSHIDLSLAPEASETRQHLRVLLSAGSFGFLSKEVRQANRVVRSIWVGGQRPNKEKRIAIFNTLNYFFLKKEELDNDLELSSILGENFLGARTPVGELRQLRSWRLELESIVGSFHPESSIHVEQIWNLSPFAIRRIRDKSRDENGNLVAILELYRASRENSHQSASTSLEGDDISEAYKRIEAAIDLAGQFLSLRRAAGLRDELTGAEVAKAVAAFLSKEEIEARLDAASRASGLLGEQDLYRTETLALIQGSLDLSRKVSGTRAPPSISAFLISADFVQRRHDLRQVNANLRTATERLAKHYETFREMAKLEPEVWFANGWREAELCDLAHRLAALPRDNRVLRGWVDYLGYRERLVTLGLGPLVDVIDKGLLEAEENRMKTAVRACLYDSMARQVYASHQELRDFRADDHERLRARFVELDLEILDLQRARIAAKLDQKQIPPGTASGRVGELTERALLDHIKGQTRPRIAVRQIVNRAAKALQAIKPCFMMGPLSVAQFLDPKSIEFDLVVMDEASQMKPEDAMGAIARSKQVVIVGDTKQLPPTSFFDRVFSTDDADDGFIATQGDSILEVASSLFQPSRYLKWHYRSRHESLIAFSNDRWYEKKLIVFPSPHDAGAQYGASVRYIENPSYRAGHNRPEAEAIARTAIDHMESGTTDSLGIVAMNRDQADLIDLEIERLLKTSAVAEEWRSRREVEPLIVKNLENIQGDERDVIFISFTYGPEGPGQPIKQRFGPINSPDGWRRLNVLFTRARKRLIAFSSMKPSDIKDSPGSQGPTAMRDYLHFAETGQLERGNPTGRPPDSAFEVAVADLLKMHGYQCDPQIGVDGYFIDIGVRHPDRPSEYIVGVECDGAPFHSGKSVRDRDRIRQSVLEKLGWNIIRIWSTEWYRHPDIEIERVAREIERLRRRSAKEARTDGLSVEMGDALSPDQSGVGDDGVSLLPQEDYEVDGSKHRDQKISSGISENEARRRLIELREKEVRRTFPSTDASNGILRRQMIKALLDFKPTTLSEFQAQIPLRLREATDGEQAQLFLPKIFEILEEIRD